MRLKIYQVDAFATKVFEGNPAAICPLEMWLSDTTMQAIASEINLSETAFFVATKRGFHIRWFSPNQEVKLCGHATLASAYVLFEKMNFGSEIIEFNSLSGILRVRKNENGYELDFPRQTPVRCQPPEMLLAAFNWLENEMAEKVEVLKAEDYLIVVPSEIQVTAAAPNLELLKQLDLRGVGITAPSEKYDFVSRFFAPKFGIPEDPVTGSSFTQLAPYWSQRIGKEKLFAKQISERGGEVGLRVTDDRVFISGGAVLFMEGEIEV